MFENIGGKIKSLAVVMCGIGIVISVIGAIAFWCNHDPYYHPTIAIGFGVLIGGCVGSWIGSFFTYGFGELIEMTQQNNQYLAQMAQQMEHQTEQLAQLSLGRRRRTGDEAPAQSAVAQHTANTNASLLGRSTLPSGGWVCSKCAAKNTSMAMYCKECGQSR